MVEKVEKIKNEYHLEVELPSRGVLYPEGIIPPKITIRNMKTSEEKLLLGSKDDYALDRIIKACIVEPDALDLDRMLLNDKHYLMLMLRSHTYGSEYKVQIKCPSCGEMNDFKVNLDDLPIKFLPEDFVEPFEVVLPMSKEKLGLRFLRTLDMRTNENIAKKRARIQKLPQLPISYVLRLMSHIETLNGEEIPKEKKQRYVEDLHGRDTAYIWFRIRDVFGVDTKITEECSGCNGEVEFELPITAEFFHPTFES